MIEITEDQYNKWLHLAVVVTSNRNSADLLHDLLLKFHRNSIDPEKMTMNYVFVSLKRLFIDEKRKNKTVDNEYELEMLSELEDEEVDHQEVYDEQKEKLDFIKYEVLNLRSSDIKLFELRYITYNEEKKRFGFSQREIARRIGVSNVLIHYKEKEILNTINDAWDNRKKITNRNKIIDSILKNKK